MKTLIRIEGKNITSTVHRKYTKVVNRNQLIVHKFKKSSKLEKEWPLRTAKQSKRVRRSNSSDSKQNQQLTRLNRPIKWTYKL